MIKAVDDVSLAIEEGEIFGLLGMNGAGKSTTVKMCTGLLAPDGGSVTVFGGDIALSETKRMLNVSPQETAVAPMLSVYENLVFIAEIYGADKATSKLQAEEIAAKLKLTDRLNDRAGKLSGGLMRRLSIGMAIITKPRLVFLDEPTLGLDVVSRRELWKYIREISGSAAVVLTTHYLEEAEALCNRIAVMAGGKIAAIGTADELKKLSGEDTFENAFLRLTGEEEYIDE
ncbi:MAG: ABC transporter ATP-binding protein [Clostridiales bacterium]|nr:ABC transporter ATP-binding protein [Clostridiales bacterium]